MQSGGEQSKQDLCCTWTILARNVQRFVPMVERIPLVDALQWATSATTATTATTAAARACAFGRHRLKAARSSAGCGRLCQEKDLVGREGLPRSNAATKAAQSIFVLRFVVGSQCQLVAPPRSNLLTHWPMKLVTERKSVDSFHFIASHSFAALLPS
jgi:hypothetical protein